MKRQGLRNGIPDLFLAVARAKGGMVYHGLYLEMKTPKGRPSSDQLEMHALLAKEGYMVVVAKSFDEAVNAIVDYLGGSRLGREVG
jgi:hypothetical protein